MRKSLTLLVILASLLVLMNPGIYANAQQPTFAVEPSSIQVSEPGQTFEVNITVTDSPAVVQWVLNLTWDPGVLDFLDIVEGNFLSQNGSTMFLVKPVEPGVLPEVTCLLMVDKVVNGNGLLCTVIFNATNVGYSVINIDWGALLDSVGNEIPVDIQDGEVTVIPEFSSLLLLLTLMATTITVVIAIKTPQKLRIQKHTE